MTRAIAQICRKSVIVIMAAALACPQAFAKLDTSTYYTTLSVPPTATLDEIKVAYRKLVKQYHTDVTGKKSHEDIAAINDAYGVLKNQEKRARYDQLLNLVQNTQARQGSAPAEGLSPVDQMFDEIRRTVTGEAQSVAKPLGQVPLGDMLSMSGVYPEFLKVVRDEIFTYEDEFIYRWIYYHRLVLNSGPMTLTPINIERLGGAGWVFRIPALILIFNVFFPAEGNTWDLGLKALAAQIFAVTPALFGMMLNQPKNQGRDYFKNWSERTQENASPLLRLKSSMMFYDLLSEWVSWWYSFGQRDRFADIVTAHVVRTVKSIPAAGEGWLLRYLTSTSGLVPLSEAGARLAVWQDRQNAALELHMKSHPGFWLKKVDSLITNLNAEGSDWSKSMAQKAGELRVKLKGYGVFTASSSWVQQKTRVSCQATVQWVKEWSEREQR